MTGATVLRADARALPLADASVDLVVTSPPYFGLRSYRDGGEHYGGQLGAETTPAEYLEALIVCTREMMRVLKPTGSIWVNLGDRYSPGGRTVYDRPDIHGERGGLTRPRDGFAPKTLLGIPWRYALRCVDELGLILRAEVIWSKPNGLPESVTDRVRRSHEQWFHFTREPRYFSAVDEIREATHRVGLTWCERKATGARTHAPDNGHMSGGPGMAANPLGKLPGSVWEIPSQPLTVPAHLGVDHFAAFPVEWPRRIILGWSPSGICAECGEGRRPRVTSERTIGKGDKHRGPTGAGRHLAWGEPGQWGAGGGTIRQLVGDACACPEPTAPTRPSVILDPFGGTGTTALVAKALGRHGISVDMSADYCRIAEWRTNDPGELAKALRVNRPPTEAAGQTDMLELIGGTP